MNVADHGSASGDSPTVSAANAAAAGLSPARRPTRYHTPAAAPASGTELARRVVYDGPKSLTHAAPQYTWATMAADAHPL